METKIENNLEIEGIDYVVCPYCKGHLPMISWTHLKHKHGKTLAEMKAEFPGIKTSCLKSIEKKRSAGLKSKETHNKLKTIRCCHCQKEMQVKNNESNTQACKECLDKGLENPDKRTSKEAQRKREKTFMEKYGVTNSHQTKDSIAKASKTNKERYGGVGFASERLAKKTKDKIRERFNVDNIMFDKNVAAKIGRLSTKENNPERARRISVALKGKESKNKGKTYEEIYGKEKAEELLKLKKEKAQRKFLENFKNYLEECNVEICDDYNDAFSINNFKCKKCGHIFQNSWNNIQQGYTCPKCYPRNDGTSQQERDIHIFIKSLDSSLEVQLNVNNLIPPKQIDLYIPSKNIAIEFNGLYWHSELKGKDRRYHLNKTLACEKQNIQLIHIFEDEWIYKKNIVKSRLKQILGINDSKRIHARKCEIFEIEPSVKNLFLEAYHIQGNDKSTIKLGAVYEDELVSVMTFSYGNIAKGSVVEEGVWELNRFCSNSNYHIPGIAGKLLKYFQRNYEWEEIFSYADRRWSNGNLYEKLGFNFEYDTKPNYWYLNKNFQRIHRFGLRKKPNEPKEITEWDLRRNEGYDRIWDCGSKRYSLKNPIYFS